MADLQQSRLPLFPIYRLQLEEHFLLEASTSKQLVELLEAVSGDVDLLLRLLPVLVIGDEDRAVVRNEIDLQANVRISVPLSQHEAPDFRQLVETSSRTSPDLALELPRFFPLEALVLHQLVDLVTSVPAQVEPFLLLPMLVEEDQIWVVMWYEIHLQTSIRVSVPRILHEAFDLRQLVQASAGASLHLGRPSARNAQRRTRRALRIGGTL